MFFAKSLVYVAAVASSALAITINAPSGSAYWVQNASNVISWSFNSGDPNPIDITVVNPNSSTLNGPFSISRNVDLHNGSFTVTDVTLRVASGYVVNFVNPANQSQIYATSSPFDVRTPGTTPVSVSIPAPSPVSSSASRSSSSSLSAASPTRTSTVPSANSGVSNNLVPFALGAMMAFVGGFAAL